MSDLKFPFFNVKEAERVWLLEMIEEWEHPENRQPGDSYEISWGKILGRPFLEVDAGFLGDPPYHISHLNLVGFHKKSVPEIEALLQQIPTVLPELYGLYYEDLHATTVPEWILQLPKLGALTLIMPNLTHLPKDLFTHLTELFTLKLYSPKLIEIPDIFHTSMKFRFLVLESAPLLTSLPSSLYRCPTLEKIKFPPPSNIVFSPDDQRALYNRAMTKHKKFERKWSDSESFAHEKEERAKAGPPIKLVYCHQLILPVWYIDYFWRIFDPLSFTPEPPPCKAVPMTLQEMFKIVRPHVKIDWTVVERIEAALRNPLEPMPTWDEVHSDPYEIK